MAFYIDLVYIAYLSVKYKRYKTFIIFRSWSSELTYHSFDILQAAEMNDSYSLSSSSPRSADLRTPRFQPRSPWTFTGSTRIDLRDLNRERVPNNAMTNVQYEPVSDTQVRGRGNVPSPRGTSDIKVHRQPSHGGDIFPRTQQRLHDTISQTPDYLMSGINGTKSPRSPHVGNISFAYSPRDFHRSISPIPDYAASRIDSANPTLSRVPDVTKTKLRNGVTNEYHIAPSKSSPVDYFERHEDVVLRSPRAKYTSTPRILERQPRTAKRNAHVQSEDSRYIPEKRAKSAPSRTDVSKQYFDPTINRHLWAMWRIGATEKIINETKMRDKRGQHNNGFSSVLQRPPGNLGRLINVTQSTRQRVGVLMDGGDRSTTSDLLTKQFIYFGLPRVTLSHVNTALRDS